MVGTKILVVDDDPNICDILKTHFESEVSLLTECVFNFSKKFNFFAEKRPLPFSLIDDRTRSVIADLHPVI